MNDTYKLMNGLPLSLGAVATLAVAVGVARRGSLSLLDYTTMPDDELSEHEARQRTSLKRRRDESMRIARTGAGTPAHIHVQRQIAWREEEFAALQAQRARRAGPGPAGDPRPPGQQVEDPANDRDPGTGRPADTARRGPRGSRTVDPRKRRADLKRVADPASGASPNERAMAQRLLREMPPPGPETPVEAETTQKSRRSGHRRPGSWSDPWSVPGGFWNPVRSPKRHARQTVEWPGWTSFMARPGDPLLAAYAHGRRVNEPGLSATGQHEHRLAWYRAGIEVLHRLARDLGLTVVRHDHRRVPGPMDDGDAVVRFASGAYPRMLAVGPVPHVILQHDWIYVDLDPGGWGFVSRRSARGETPAPVREWPRTRSGKRPTDEREAPRWIAGAPRWGWVAGDPVSYDGLVQLVRELLDADTVHSRDPAGSRGILDWPSARTPEQIARDQEDRRIQAERLAERQAERQRIRRSSDLTVAQIQAILRAARLPVTGDRVTLVRQLAKLDALRNTDPRSIASMTVRQLKDLLAPLRAGRGLTTRPRLLARVLELQGPLAPVAAHKKTPAAPRAILWTNPFTGRTETLGWVRSALQEQATLAAWGRRHAEAYQDAVHHVHDLHEPDVRPGESGYPEASEADREAFFAIARLERSTMGPALAGDLGRLAAIRWQVQQVIAGRKVSQ